jgi:methylated-DNA-protein-cysteine methyltransferase-like protein
MRNIDEDSYRKQVYNIVSQIPHGKIMTYGQIADILGEGYTARTIGYVMHLASSVNIPWQRVINSQGSCSTAKITVPHNLQQNLLEKEGVVFKGEKCDLNVYRWTPEGVEKDNHPSLFD